MFLRRPELAKHTSDLTSVSRRILLSGPAGTELYQETLVKALAAELNASLFIFDAAKAFALDSSASAAGAGWAQLGYGAAVPALASSAPDTPAGLSGPARFYAMYATELADAEAIHTYEPWMPRRSFRRGDRVRFIGGAWSSPPPLPPGFDYVSPLSPLHSVTPRRGSNSYSATAGNSIANGPGGGGSSGAESRFRGPQTGARGKVVMTFDTDNPRKVGVKFDRPVPGGGNLGGQCEDGYGMCVISYYYIIILFII